MTAMKNALRVAFALLAALAFAYRPTVFLVDCALAIVYYYLLYEHLFNPKLVDRAAQLPRKLPDQVEFLRTKVRHLIALIDEDCIICRDEPTAPVQVLPCKHVFCNDCFQHFLLTVRILPGSSSPAATTARPPQLLPFIQVSETPANTACRV